MKKVFTFLMVIILALSCFTACSTQKTEGYPLSVNGTPIDGEIFRYYIDDVWNSPEAGGGKDGRITQATYKCIRYVAVNSTFAAYGLSLTDDEKSLLAEEVNSLWNMFGTHYKNIGVSKETFLKIKTSDAYIEKLRIAFFDKGGTDEISDAVLRGILLDKFIAFRYIRVPLTDTDVYGNEHPLSDEEVARLNTVFNKALTQMTTQYGIDNAYATVSQDFPFAEQTFETIVAGSDDHEFSSSFYDKIKTVAEGNASAFQYEDYAYLVYRVNILTDASIFADKRDECLKIVSEDPLQSKINVMCNAYTSVREPSLVNEYYNKVGNNR